MPEPMPSKAEFSRSLGVSAAAITKAIKAGHVILDGDGRVNTHDPRTQKYMTRPPRERRAAQKAAARKDPEPEIPNTPAGPPLPQDTACPPRSEMGGNRLSGQEDTDDLDDRKTLQQIEKLRLDNESTRLELIPREGVKHFVGQIAGAHSSILLPLGGRLAKQLASELGVTDSAAIIRVEETIQAECYQVIGMIKRKIKDYLKSIKAEDRAPELFDSRPRA